MFCPDDNKTTIAIFGSPRSGSTFAFHNLVTGLISEHSEYNTEFNRERYGGEPFRDEIDHWGMNMQQRYNLFPDTHWIAKFHLLDMMNANKQGWDKDIIARTDYKVLLLRRNLWESALSMSISSYKNQWINNLDTKQIDIPVELFERMLDLQIRTVNHMWGDNDFEIEYDQFIFTEDLTDNPNDLYESITGNRLDNNIINHIEKSPPKNKIITNLDQLRQVYESSEKDLHGKTSLDGDWINFNE